MAKPENYPPRKSKVTIEFLDGEIKEYEITAGCGILPYLMREAGDTGTLVLLNGPEAHGIPMVNVRNIELKELDS